MEKCQVKCISFSPRETGHVYICKRRVPRETEILKTEVMERRESTRQMSMKYKNQANSPQLKEDKLPIISYERSPKGEGIDSVSISSLHSLCSSKPSKLPSVENSQVKHGI